MPGFADSFWSSDYAGGKNPSESESLLLLFFFPSSLLLLILLFYSLFMFPYLIISYRPGCPLRQATTRCTREPTDA
jgi:hypothetical protein